MADFKQADAGYTQKLAEEILEEVKSRYGDIETLREEADLLKQMSLSGLHFAPLLDSSGNMILDTDGNAVVAEWQT